MAFFRCRAASFDWRGGEAKEDRVKEIFLEAGGGGACLWISIQFL